MGNCPSSNHFICPLLQSYYVNTDYLLPSLGADPSSVTVSGFSYGSTMAGDMHVIFSETVKGSGQIDGTPYYGKTGSDGTASIN